MEKLMYVVWKDPERTGDQTRTALIDQVAPALTSLGASGLTVAVRDTDAEQSPVDSLVRGTGQPEHQATLQLWVEAYDRCQTEIENVLTAAWLRFSGYLMIESTFENYGDTAFGQLRDWPDGTRSPGMLQVALISFRPDRTPAEIIAAWKSHGPISATIHPRSRYVRNEVVRAITPDAPHIDGIVDEGFPSARHASEPDLRFRGEGDPGWLEEQKGRMDSSVDRFVDRSRSRSTFMSEYFLTSRSSRA